MSLKQPSRSITKFFDSLTSFPLTVEGNDEMGLGEFEGSFEATLFECPPALGRDFASLFPDVESFRQRKSFSVLLLGFATINDMSGWNQGVEKERELLHRTFMRIGDDVAGRLVGGGFWADWVDPVGGKPYRGSYCNDNLFETDPRLRPFGVKVNDLGCCKCINLQRFGSKAFVGCVFTDAAFDSAVWRDIF